MEHHFSVELACKYGILEAVILNHLAFWISKNEANGHNIFEGRAWTHNSIEAFAKLFPYVSIGTIRNAVKHLITEGIIQTGNFNKQPSDRTLWYSFTDEGREVVQNLANAFAKIYQMDLSKSENAFVKNCAALPYNNPYNNNIYIPIESGGQAPEHAPEEKEEKPKAEGKAASRFVPPTVEEVRAYCEERRNGIDAQRFVDYYEARGWRYGKTGMKDWRAAVRTWERTEKADKAETQTAPSSFDTNEFFEAALRQSYAKGGEKRV